MEKGVSTLLFDLGGVILNLNYQLTIEAFKKIGGENFDERYSQAAQNPLFDQFETGSISEQAFRDGIRTLLRLEVDDQLIDEAWNAMLLDLPQDRIDLLTVLKQDYRLYLFSNTNAIHFRKFQAIIENQYGKPDLLESLFHKTYYSHTLGQRKPHATAFQSILVDQGLKSNEVLFIDDSLQHIKGAESIGIKAVHLKDSTITELFKNRV